MYLINIKVSIQFWPCLPFCSSLHVDIFRNSDCQKAGVLTSNDQWPIHYFPKEGQPTPGAPIYYLAKNLPKAAWKWKNCTERGGLSLAPFLDPPLNKLIISSIQSLCEMFSQLTGFESSIAIIWNLADDFRVSFFNSFWDLTPRTVCLRFLPWSNGLWTDYLLVVRQLPSGLIIACVHCPSMKSHLLIQLLTDP